MNSKVTHLAAFLTGAAAGGAAAWYFVKKEYERIADEEIKSVKETYSRREAIVVKSPEEITTVSQTQEGAYVDGRIIRTPMSESVLEYAARLRKEGYVPDEDDGKEETAMPANSVVPYIISPTEYGEMDGYETFSLTYYSDGTLTDENDEVVDDVEEAVGPDFHNHFGEYEDDSVFVRNDARKCDYEILLDQRPYSEVLKAKPYLNRKG